MPDSPLLTPEALKAAQDAVARSGLFYVDSAPTARTVARALLAAHDPEALAQEYDLHLLAKGELASEEARAEVLAAFRWLGLGGDDA
jgi:hypothetical protein